MSAKSQIVRHTSALAYSDRSGINRSSKQVCRHSYTLPDNASCKAAERRSRYALWTLSISKLCWNVCRNWGGKTKLEKRNLDEAFFLVVL